MLSTCFVLELRAFGVFAIRNNRIEPGIRDKIRINRQVGKKMNLLEYENE